MRTIYRSNHFPAAGCILLPFLAILLLPFILLGGILAAIFGTRRTVAGRAPSAPPPTTADHDPAAGTPECEAAEPSAYEFGDGEVIDVEAVTVKDNHES